MFPLTLTLFHSNVYAEWLSHGKQRVGAFDALKQSLSGGLGIATEIEALLARDGLSLQSAWESVCAKSVKVHDDYGAIGHLGLNSGNIYLEQQNGEEWNYEPLGADRIAIWKEKGGLGKIYIPNHSGIAMIDPAIEAGFVLEQLISSRFAASTAARDLGRDSNLIDDSSSDKIREIFLDIYSKTMEQQLAGDRTPLPSIEPNEVCAVMKSLLARACHVAAVWLVLRYQNRCEYDLERSDWYRLIQTSLDLLHYGIRDVPFQFKD